MITVGGWIILATQSVTLLAALLSLWSSRKNKAAIQSIHVSINSRMDQLLAATKSDAHQAGVTEGQANTFAADPAKVEVVKSVPVKIEGKAS